MDTYSKPEIDLKLELQDKERTILLNKILDAFKSTQMEVHAIKLDQQWLKWLLLASLFTIIASKFFHI